MNILYIHQYFKIPEEGGCVRSYHLAKGIVEHGHQVTMITAHNTKRGNEIVDGINVLYLPISYQNRFGFIRRVIAFIQFVYQSKNLIRKLKPKYDLAYVMTTPLTTGLIALHLKSVYNIPYYFEVGDLWPEAPIQMGLIKNRFLKKGLYHFESKCYFHAQKVIALSPDIRNYIEGVSPQTKVHVLPNFSDLDLFDFNRKIKRFDITNPLKVCYAGTFGQANHLEYLIAAAQSCLEAQVPITFTLIGEGKTLDKINTLAKTLDNVNILPFGNLANVKALLEASDVSYVSFQNTEVLSSGSPNKFFDGLAAGNLIVSNFGGWIKGVIEKNNIGFTYDPEDSESFVSKIKLYIDQPEKLLKHQQNSRMLGEKYYSKELQVQKLNEILENKKQLDFSDSEVYILTA